MANNCKHLDTLAKHCPVNGKKHAAVHSIFIKEYENRFQDHQKVINFLVYFRFHFQSTKIHDLHNFKWNALSCNQIFNPQDLIVSLYWSFVSLALTIAERSIPQSKSCVIHIITL